MAAFFISYGEFLQIAPFRVGFYLIIFEVNLEDTFACFEKYSSKLDISRSLITIFAFTYRLLNHAKGYVSVCVCFIEKRLLTLFLGFS